MGVLKKLAAQIAKEHAESKREMDRLRAEDEAARAAGKPSIWKGK